MEDILAIVLLFGGGTVAALAYSPVGRALADRIRGRAPLARGLDDDADDRLRVLERRVVELEERADFAERLLAQQREAERLPPGR